MCACGGGGGGGGGLLLPLKWLLHYRMGSEERHFVVSKVFHCINIDMER